MNAPTDAGAPTPEPQPTPPGGPAGSGLPENVAGALCYLLGPITGVVFFLIDRQRSFVRFHAVQAIGITIAWVVIAIVLMIVSTVLGFVPILGWIVSILLNLGLAIAGFGLWMWLMYQAYSGNRWAFPIIGPHVKRIAAETGGEANAA